MLKKHKKIYQYLYKINKNEKLIEGTNNRKNFGYATPSKIYHELEIDKFLTI